MTYLKVQIFLGFTKWNYKACFYYLRKIKLHLKRSIKRFVQKKKRIKPKMVVSEEKIFPAYCANETSKWCAEFFLNKFVSRYLDLGGARKEKLKENSLNVTSDNKR